MFFNNCTTIEDLKQEYHRLAMLHHPDKGGDTATMQMINAEFEAIFPTLASVEETRMDAEFSQDYRDVIDDIIHFDGIDIEVCGKWIWVNGNTYYYKDALKTAGFFWASKKKSWYWRPADQKRSRRKPQTMDWIRNKYGSFKVEPEPSISYIA